MWWAGIATRNRIAYAQSRSRTPRASDKYEVLKEVYQWIVERPQDIPLPPFPTRTIAMRI